jgi:hypothetical protein
MRGAGRATCVRRGSGAAGRGTCRRGPCSAGMRQRGVRWGGGGSRLRGGWWARGGARMSPLIWARARGDGSQAIEVPNAAGSSPFCISSCATLSRCCSSSATMFFSPPLLMGCVLSFRVLGFDFPNTLFVKMEGASSRLITTISNHRRESGETTFTDDLG